MQWPIREKTAMEVVGSRMHAPWNVYSQIWCGRLGYFISFNVRHAKYVAPVTVHCGRNVMPSLSSLLKSTMSEPIVVFTWRSILKLPQLCISNNQSYQLLFYEIHWSVPSVLSCDRTGHMIIAAIFESGNLFFSVISSQKSVCHCYIICCMQLLLRDYYTLVRHSRIY